MQTPEEIVRLCVARGIRVVLLPEVFVSDIGTDRESHEYYEVFRELAARHAGEGVYYGELKDALDPETAMSTFIDAVHMTDEGYGIFAGEIHALLVEEGILAEPGGALDPDAIAPSPTYGSGSAQE